MLLEYSSCEHVARTVGVAMHARDVALNPRQFPCFKSYIYHKLGLARLNEVFRPRSSLIVLCIIYFDLSFIRVVNRKVTLYGLL